MKIWQLQEAKNKLSELIERAQKDGPQIITRRGHKTAIVISVEYYEKLINLKNDLADFFKKSPLYGVDLEIERSNDTMRDVEL